MGPRSMGYSW